MFCLQLQQKYQWIYAWDFHAPVVNGQCVVVVGLKGLLQLRFEHDSSTIPARFEHIRARHATTRYEVFRMLAYEIDSSTPRESVVGVSCMLIDS